MATAVLILVMGYSLIYLSMDVLWRIVLWKHNRNMRKRGKR